MVLFDETIRLFVFGANFLKNKENHYSDKQLHFCRLVDLIQLVTVCRQR